MQLKLIKRASMQVLAYEPLTNHDNKGANFLFCDGHVEYRPPSTAATLLAQIAARTAATQATQATAPATTAPGETQ